MSRSSKKGPYVDIRLLDRIETMNRANEKRVLRTWSRDSTSFRRWSGILSLFTMGDGTCRCM